MAESIKEILIRRDNLTLVEADNIINEAREALSNYIDEGDLDAAEYICQEYFGLEPDYLDELM